MFDGPAGRSSLIDAADGKIEAFIHGPDAIHRCEMTVLLVDAGTSPTAETLSAVIRFHHRQNCLVIGETTPGRAAHYESVALGSAQLRYVKTGIRLPDGTDLFKIGLIPDIAVAASPTQLNTVLQLNYNKSLTDYIT